MLEKTGCQFYASPFTFLHFLPYQHANDSNQKKFQKMKKETTQATIAPAIAIWNIFINVLFKTCPTQWNRCLKLCILQCISFSHSFWTCIYMPTRLHKFQTGPIIAQINDATRKELSCFQRSNNHVRGAVGMKMIELHLFSEIFSGMNHPLHNV